MAGMIAEDELVKKRGKDRNAHLPQFTTDKKRSKAIKFYEDLGFKDTHEGIKMHVR